MTDNSPFPNIRVIEHNPTGLPPEPSIEVAEQILSGSVLEYAELECAEQINQYWC